ncbi:MAG: hypothetical protein OXI96_10200 [Acidimicrobiaceae bacterium]|nr:hypothetical protein [Acidimicrobiaceae bacterium]
MRSLVTFARRVNYVRQSVFRRVLRDDLLIAPGPPVPLWPSAANLYEQGMMRIKTGGWRMECTQLPPRAPLRLLGDGGSLRSGMQRGPVPLR